MEMDETNSQDGFKKSKEIRDKKTRRKDKQEGKTQGMRDARVGL